MIGIFLGQRFFFWTGFCLSVGMKETTDFLNQHSLNYLEMALGHERVERVENPDWYGRRTGVCGDTVEFFLAVENGRIQSASFWIDGCINTHACSNTAAVMAEGRTLEEAWQITPEQVADFLETLPEDDHHCAELAVGALYLALKNAGRKG